MGNKINKFKKEEITKYYSIKETLGNGSFAVVKRGIRLKDKKEFAIKIIKKRNLRYEELASLNDEVEIMHKIEHKHIVKLYEIYDSPRKLYMVIELLTGGELFERIVKKGQYSEKQASILIKDITLAIEYLHENSIVHRDLKPENILYQTKFDDSEIKITDFGLAKLQSTKRMDMSTACGTPGYVAPEILKNKGYNEQVDLWSIGVILYILLCGFPPFYDENVNKLYMMIKKGDYDFPDPYWTEISDEAKDLVSKLLTVDPQKRISTNLLLSHKWITNSKEISERPLGEEFNKRLISFNARRRFRRGIHLVTAVYRFYRIIEDVE